MVYIYVFCSVENATKMSKSGECASGGQSSPYSET